MYSHRFFTLVPLFFLACQGSEAVVTQTEADDTETVALSSSIWRDGRAYRLNTPMFEPIVATQIPAQEFKIKESGPLKGAKFYLPFNYLGARGLVALGSADTQALNAILREHGLEAYPTEQHLYYPLLAQDPAVKAYLAGRSFVDVYGNTYAQSSAGPVSPSFSLVWVKNPRDPSGSPAMFFLDYIVNTEASQAYGVEAWGIVKRLGDTQADFDGNSKGFRSAYNGEPVLDMAIADASRLSPATPFRFAFTAITPKSSVGPGQTFNSIEYGGVGFQTAPFQPVDANGQPRDRFYANPKTFFGANLARMQYTPMVWVYTGLLEGVFHTDLTQLPRHKNDPVTDGSAPGTRTF